MAKPQGWFGKEWEQAECRACYSGVTIREYHTPECIAAKKNAKANAKKRIAERRKARTNDSKG